MRATVASGADSLVGIDRNGAAVKPALLRALTELYVQRPSHTAEEERQFVELAARLLPAVDPAAKAEIARLLSTYLAAPAEILLKLAGAPAALAACSTVERENTSEAVAITQRFFAASSEQRVALLAEIEARGLVEPSPAGLTPQTARILEMSALAGRPSELIRELESALGIRRAIAEAIVNDPSGEPLVIAAKALAIPIDVLQRVLLFVNPSIGHSVRRVYALSAWFEQISSGAAWRLVAAWRKADGAATPRRSSLPPPTGRQTFASKLAAAPRVEAANPHGNGSASSANNPIEKVAS